MSRYKYTFPSLFSLLLSSQDATVSLGLRLAREAWDTISAADLQAKLNPSVKAALSSVTWAGDLFVRETFLLLAQHSVEFLCPPARTMISDAIDGCMQTAVCENANGACRDRQRDNTNLKMSRLSRYMFPVTREVLAVFKFTEVSVSEADRVAPASERSLPDLCFSAGGCTWASPTPQCEELSVGAWCFLKGVASSVDWAAAAQNMEGRSDSRDGVAAAQPGLRLLLGLVLHNLGLLGVAGILEGAGPRRPDQHGRH